MNPISAWMARNMSREQILRLRGVAAFVFWMLALAFISILIVSVSR